MLQIVSDFLEPVDNDIPTNEERRLRDLDKEAEEEDDGDYDPNLRAETYALKCSDDIDEI